MEPLWGVGDEPGDFVGYLAEQVGVDREDVLSWDVMTHPVQPSTRLGRARELIAAPRLDNLATSYAGVRALLDAVATEPAHVPVLVLFDHEEIGSTSERGATSTLLPSVLERIVTAGGGTRDDYWRALAATVIASGDMGHATHPNYADRHEPMHQIRVNGGPVLKVNTNLRYATDSVGAAAFRLACEQAGVPMQTFVTRSDLPCGSTVGPVTSSLTGATTVDFGAAALSMHSTRELDGRRGPGDVCRGAERVPRPGLSRGGGRSGAVGGHAATAYAAGRLRTAPGAGARSAWRPRSSCRTGRPSSTTPTAGSARAACSSSSGGSTGATATTCGPGRRSTSRPWA